MTLIWIYLRSTNGGIKFKIVATKFIKREFTTSLIQMALHQTKKPKPNLVLMRILDFKI